MTVGFPTAGAQSTNITTSTNTQVKTGAGIFLGLSVNTGQSGASATVYDGTSAAGKKLGAYSAAAQGGPVLPQAGLAFTTGLFVVTAGATPADITIAWN